MVIAFIFVFGCWSLRGQNPSLTPDFVHADVRFRVSEPGHPWRPPFGTDRIGSFNEVIIFFRQRNFLRGNFNWRVSGVERK